MPLAFLLSAYVALAIAAPVLANSMLYYPQLGSHRAPANVHEVRTSTGETIAILHIPNPSAHFTVWYFHGNAEDLGDIEPYLMALHDAGYAVFALDYPGYGRSSGRPSEARIYAAATTARDYLRRELGVSADHTLIYGRSLGSGPAVQMATEERVGGLIIESGFMSAYRVVTRWPIVPFDQFRNLAKLPRVKSPILVIHGDADRVIPFVHGKALFKTAAEPKRSLWIAGAGHNDLISVAGPRYWQALREFTELCATASGSNRE